MLNLQYLLDFPVFNYGLIFLRFTYFLICLERPVFIVAIHKFSDLASYADLLDIVRVWYEL